VQLAQKNERGSENDVQSSINEDIRQKLNFIDSLQHFGVSYLF